jgi:hypothetical protein
MCDSLGKGFMIDSRNLAVPGRRLHSTSVHFGCNRNAIAVR